MNISDLTFKTNEKKPEYPFSYLNINKVKGDAIFKESLIDQEVKDFTLPLDIILYSDEDKEHGAKAYQLYNGYILIAKKYSYTLYPSLNDVENHLKATAHWKEQAKNYVPTTFYKKLLDPVDPRERIFLTNDGEAHTYWQYSPALGQALMKDFPTREAISLSKYSIKWLGEDGRVLYSLDPKSEHIPVVVFNNEQDFAEYSQPWSWKNPSASARMWRGRNPYGKDLLEQKEALLQQLADILEMKHSAFRFGPGTHHGVHEALEQLIYTDQVAQMLFLPLTMYLGEQQIAVYGGEWKMVEEPLIESWIPHIHFQGEDYDIGRQILYDLLDTETTDFPSIATVLWSGRTRRPSLP